MEGSDHSRLAVRVLLVDDNVRARAGVARLLADEPGIELIADAPDGETAIARAQELSPDVVLMDLDMPGMSGLEATRRIAATPHAPAVVVLTVSDRTDDLAQAILSGARGYVLKGTSGGQIAVAIRSAAKGETFLSPAVAGRLLSLWRPEPPPPGASDADRIRLSERETAVLRLIAIGKENAEIASELVISPNTVRRHVQSILKKLGIDNRTQAAVHAVRSNLI